MKLFTDNERAIDVGSDILSVSAEFAATYLAMRQALKTGGQHNGNTIPKIGDLNNKNKNAAKVKPSISAKDVTEIKEIFTPYGSAIQSTRQNAQTALRQVQNGATVYKGGRFERSEISASQFLSLESPLSIGYASRYGIPPQNSNFDFILTGRIQPNAPVITRPAPGIPPNLGGGIEAVTNPGSFKIDSFYMPD